MSNFGYPIMDEIKTLPGCPYGPSGNREIGVREACNTVRLDGDWVEFGVYQGQTANWILEYLPSDSSLHLFDSFEGLSRDWSALPAGTFATEPPKFDDPRVRLHEGWFEDTVNVLENLNIAFIHIDCDLYESTVDALKGLPRLRPGTLILFDEYVHNLGGKPVDDEHRAFTEWISDTGYRFKYLWRTAWTQVCVEIVGG
jgi:hypothetical protein